MSMEGSAWKAFTRKHWRAILVFALGAVLAFAGAVYVFLWFVNNAESSGLVPGILGSWTMANLVTFILHTVFWELLLVGIPVAIAGVAAWQWWKRLPQEELRGLHFTGRKRSTGGGGGSLLFFIVFCIKVYIDGKWNVPIASFTLDYVVGSAIIILELGLIVFGVLAAIGLTWWISRGVKRPSILPPPS